MLFFSTVCYIQSQKAKGGAIAEKFEQIKLNVIPNFVRDAHTEKEEF
ncbi:hypothetical protein Hanom_Chr02g00103171 [Helianthus anomalus]